MDSAKNEIFDTVVSSVKASVTVVLVLSTGWIAYNAGWLTQEGENSIHFLGVNFFLPCLLFSEIGPLATPSDLLSYWPIAPLSLLFQLISLLVAEATSRFGGMPRHHVPAFVFPNVTSLPLLLLATMSKTEAFSKVLVPHGEELEAVISRGRIYILLNALFNHVTRFTLGPYLMQPYSDTPPKRGAIALPLGEGHAPKARNQTLWRRVKRALTWVRECINPPMIGGAVGIIAGVAPSVIHEALFDDKGWASPIGVAADYLGELYTSLEMFALGAAIWSKGHLRRSGVPALILSWLLLYRFVVAPAISIGTIWALRKWLPGMMLHDPMLDYVLMLANTGPPALNLHAITHLAELESNSIEGQIGRVLMWSYSFTPAIALPMTAVLRVLGSRHSDE